MPLDYFAGLVGRARMGEDPSSSPLQVINPTRHFGEPLPERQWIVDQWLPAPAVTLFYADGGVGKTLVAQQLLTACATGTPWLGLRVERCRSFGLFTEDDGDELQRRQDAINNRAGLNFGDLADVGWVTGVGQDNVLLRFGPDGSPSITARYDDLLAEAQAHGARLLVIDGAADTFGGNENDRGQVRQFIGALNRMAMALNGGVLLIAHPSRAGLASGNLDGGSTAWNNSARSRWSLARPLDDNGKEALDSHDRILTRRKANYSTVGDVIKLRWDAGVIVPMSSGSTLSAAAARQQCANAFLEMLDRAEREGRPVSASSRAGNYAPKQFSEMADGRKFSAREFSQAMEALFEQRVIKVQLYGKASDRTRRIVRIGDVKDEQPL